MESYKQKIRNSAILIGYLNLVIHMDSYKDVKEEYLSILNIISDWVNDYLKNHHLNNISSQDIYKIYNRIDLIREKKLFDKNIGDEKSFSDEILIWYEIVFCNGIGSE